MRFMLNWLFTSIAIAIATFLVPGIQPFGFAEAWVCFAFVGLFLNIVDSLVKPFLTVISLPLTIITLGVFQLVVNSFMLELASYLSVNLLDPAGDPTCVVHKMIIDATTPIAPDRRGDYGEELDQPLTTEAWTQKLDLLIKGMAK